MDYKKGKFSVGKTVVIKEGAWISMDGTKGEVYLGQVPKVEPKLTGDFGTFMKWADEIRVLKVRTNADTPHDSGVARAFGAQGIGLCRTEHMFFEGERISAVRQMILSEDLEGRKKALAKILPMQREDFVGIFRAMAGLPVTHPHPGPALARVPARDINDNKEISRAGQGNGRETRPDQEKDRLPGRVQPHAGNPRLPPGHQLSRDHRDAGPGHLRGRLPGWPREGKRVMPEIMIPLVGHVNELKIQRAIVEEVAQEVMDQARREDQLHGGHHDRAAPRRLDRRPDRRPRPSSSPSAPTTSPRPPSACPATTPAQLSGRLRDRRHPAQRSLRQHRRSRAWASWWPWAWTKGRATRAGLKCGICGEHGGDPDSIDFCHRIGLDYVSCSPYRVPIARLVRGSGCHSPRAPQESGAQKEGRCQEESRAQESQGRQEKVDNNIMTGRAPCRGERGPLATQSRRV